MKKCLLIIFCLFLFSCGLLPSNLQASFDASKKVSGGGSGNQGIGEAKANLNLDQNKSKNYERSIIDSQDITSEASSSQDTSKYSIGGTHEDFSKKTTHTTTKNKTDDESYSASNMIINKAQSIADEIFSIINTNITVIWSILCFYFGIILERRKHKKQKN